MYADGLIKAKRISIKNFKKYISKRNLKNIFVVTDGEIPISVNLPYSDMLNLMDIIDELSDQDTLKAIAHGRQSIRKRSKGISINNLFVKK